MVVHVAATAQLEEHMFVSFWPRHMQGHRLQPCIPVDPWSTWVVECSPVCWPIGCEPFSKGFGGTPQCSSIDWPMLKSLLFGHHDGCSLPAFFCCWDHHLWKDSLAEGTHLIPWPNNVVSLTINNHLGKFEKCLINWQLKHHPIQRWRLLAWFAGVQTPTLPRYFSQPEPWRQPAGLIWQHHHSLDMTGLEFGLYDFVL